MLHSVLLFVSAKVAAFALAAGAWREKFEAATFKRAEVAMESEVAQNYC